MRPLRQAKILLCNSNPAVGSLKELKFKAYLKGTVTFKEFQKKETKGNLRYLVEFYVDNFMSLIILATKEEMLHIATAVMTGIHDVFPKDGNNNNNPILLKKIKKGESKLSMQKHFLDLNSMAKRNRCG